MAFRVRSRIDGLLIGLAFLSGCIHDPSPSSGLTIPDVWIDQGHPGWVESQGILFLEGTPFSGWVFQMDQQGDTLFKGSYLDGRAEGRHEAWYDNGQVSESRHFVASRLEGRGRKWYPDGQLAFDATYIQDHYEGPVRSWYPNGQPYEQFHYQNGKEEGRQQRWDEQGNVLANYVVRQGRKYGLSGTKNCASPFEQDTVALPPRELVRTGMPSGN